MDVSRRTFIKSAGALAMLAPIVSIAGCSSKSKGGTSSASTSSSQSANQASQGAASPAGAAAAWKAGTLGMLANAVHKTYATGGAGAKINMLAQLVPSDVKITWDIENYTAMQQLELRQAALGSSDLSLFFALQDWATPQFLNLLEPLDQYLARSPIVDFGGIEAGLLEGFKRNGKLYGIPMSPVVDVLYYNKDKASKAGYPAGPKTFEDALKIAKAASGKGPNGAPNYGMRYTGTGADLTNWARIYGGDVITSDYQIKFTEQPVLDALAALHDLYTAGAIPQDFFNMSADDWLRLEQQGQVALSIRGTGYFTKLNDPATSKEAGHLGVVPVPGAASTGLAAAHVPTETWYMVIPKNASNKTDAWEMIRALSTPESTLNMTLNTNTPVRPAILSDPKVASTLDPNLLSAMKAALGAAAPGIPGFDHAPDAEKILQNQSVLAIQGKASPAEAMSKAAAQIKPLLPS